ncbi:DUF1501 domain-containing protein [Blastopirellula sp. J2-11]|uniref:DUF1501 domain-containing protein n=1 Tax=Blastopirellula sp. J2-11 TaxID=2943192 RepID=UPI0021CAA00C|nr:DUF1501 domain-containing protein [Blastopirellula sp. J2-11]UUO06635.1 DUF1501 domain-containing protein [Blastopirellula sp. J2-11]
MNHRHEQLQSITRRHFLSAMQLGVGGMALGSLLSGESQADEISIDPSQPMSPRKAQYAPKAKSVIYLHLAGSPPNLDLFDYKPELVKRTGADCPAEFLAGKEFAFTKGTPTLLGTPHKFRQCGESGAWLSDALVKFEEVVDDICFIKSMNTDQFNHAPAELLLYTGSPRLGRPSMGSWVTYGLGSENQNLPGFVVLNSGGSNPSSGKSAWGSGFLPSVFQGVQCRSQGDPVLYLSNPKGMPRDVRRMSLDAIRDLNQAQASVIGDPETETRIAQYELAYRMQASAPETMDISQETADTLTKYGAEPGDGSFASNCLLARRLVEQGVRYVQLFDWGWDFHGTNPSESLGDGLRTKAKRIDEPVTALIQDLKQRGLLEDTLVICGGEFGRTPFREGRTAGSQNLGRDHYPDCFTLMMAGGGIKPGITYGATDELGFQVTENKVHVHDLQATILHLMGMDHLKLTYPFAGRDFRLTDVHGELVPGILA